MPGNMDDESFDIRPARAEDVPALIDLTRRAWLSGNCELAPIEAVRHWVAEDFESRWYAEEWHRVHLALVGGRPAGLVLVEEAEVGGLWVHPSFQRRGIGSRLMDLGEDAIRTAGHAQARLQYSEWNVAAPLFYRARGYVESGSFSDMFGVERRVIAMCLDL